MTKDYYKILDISEFSTSDEIKCAYRKLARKWHPDVAGNTPDILSKFKDINEAYEILSDRIKKTDYDKARQFYSYAKGDTKFSNTAKTETKTKTEEKKDKCKKNFTFNWEDFIKNKIRESQFKKEQSTKTAKKGKDIYSDIEITLTEAASGVVKTVNMLQTQVCPTCGGRKFVNGGYCHNCNGKGKISTYKKFNVRIPAGIKSNSKIRLSGEGEKGLNGGENGDLYLTVHILNPKGYTTECDTVFKTIYIAPHEALFGTTIELETPQGLVNLTINPNTKNNQKIRLTSCGIQTKNSVGDMIVTVEIQIPNNLSQEEIDLYKKLQELSLNKIK